MTNVTKFSNVQIYRYNIYEKGMRFDYFVCHTQNPISIEETPQKNWITQRLNISSAHLDSS